MESNAHLRPYLLYAPGMAADIVTRIQLTAPLHHIWGECDATARQDARKALQHDADS